MQSGSHIGVRETRRILGDYTLTGHDILAARPFPDAVAHGAYPIDIHNPEGTGTLLKRVPMRPLLRHPAALSAAAGDGPAAGRGALHLGHARGALLLPCDAHRHGHRAGGRMCAALAARQGCAPREVAHPLVQDELLRQGARPRTGTAPAPRW